MTCDVEVLWGYRITSLGGSDDDAKLSCDTYLNPDLFLHVGGIVFGLARTVDSLTLCGRGGEVVDSASGGSFPVLHLDQGGRTRRRGEGSGTRHQKGTGSIGMSW